MDEIATQKRLERAACFKMAIFLALGGIVFAAVPNMSAFKRLADNGFAYTPNMLSIANFIGAGIYVWLSESEYAWMIKPAVRAVFFFIASIPIVAYLVPAGLVAVATNTTVNAFTYIFIYAVIILLIMAVFHGYSRRRERMMIGGMAVYMLIAASIFNSNAYQEPITASSAFNGDGTVFIFHLPVWILTMIALLGGLSYLVMLTPLAKRVSFYRHRVWFIVSESIIPLYALFQFANTVIAGGSWFVPVALIDVYFLIALLHYATYRGKDARLAT